MWLYTLATIYFVTVMGFDVQDQNDLALQRGQPGLQWPKTYTIKATRVSLTTDIIEDYVAWKTKRSSRIDYNQGAVKVIVNLDDQGFKKHEMRPETKDAVVNKLVCHVPKNLLMKPCMNITLENILPKVPTKKFKPVGKEIVNNLNTVKFEYKNKTKLFSKRNTLWAYYVHGTGWIPVRYEENTFVAKTQAMHNIWTFFDFHKEFEKDVFDIHQFGCNDMILHTSDSDEVVKELLLINPENEDHVDHVFNQFKNRFERQYGHENEHELRRIIFAENMRLISSVNRQNLGYKLGVNQFSDRSSEELANSLGYIPEPEGMVGAIPFPYDETELNDIVHSLPKNYDMRLHGFVSHVKNQGSCGSCWTFAATAAVESGLARTNGGQVFSLSNQAVIDCAYKYLPNGYGGCNGGNAYAAYTFMRNYGLPTDQEYGPYLNREGVCDITNMNKTYKITGYISLPKNNTNAMKVAVVNHGPLYVSVNVTKPFYDYSSGIYYQTKIKCNPNGHNHAVTLVGYGERDGDKFWIIKNSWGESWGMNGYMLISAKNNICGVNSHPSYPVF